MSTMIQFIAVLSCLIFTGAAIYINLVEHPARLSCGTRIAATVWAPCYQRATLMQASLAVISLITGFLSWFISGSILWLIAAICIGFVVPFTFIVIMPVNKELLEADRDLASEETLTLLVQWGNLHAVRSLLSFIGSLVYLVALRSS